MYKFTHTYLLMLLAALCLISCKSNTKKVKTIEKFPQTIYLNGKGIVTDELNNMKEIIGICDSIIILSNYKDTFNFYLINKNNFKVINKAVKRGRGPMEVPWNSGTFLDSTKKILHVSSKAKPHLLSFHVKSLLQKELNPPDKSIKIPDNYNSYTQIQLINDSIIALNGSKKYSVILINKKGKEIKKLGKLPSKPEGIKAVHYSNMNVNDFTYNSYRKQLATGFYRMDKIVSYNLNGEKEFETKGPGDSKADYDKLYKSVEKKAYFSIKSDKNFIYALYSGRIGHKALSKAKTLNNIKRLYPKTIHVFDWEGNPKLEVNLRQECRDFTIDRETNRLITLSPSDTTFYTYDFNKINKKLD